MNPKKIGKCTLLGLGVILNLLALAALLASAYGGLVDPRRSAIWALLVMGFPIVLIANIVLLGVNFFISRRLLFFINVIALVSCLGPIFNYSPVNLFPGKVDDSNRNRTFTLLTYNTYQFEYADGEYLPPALNKTMSFIMHTQPDIVALQESAHLTPLDRWRYNKAQFDSLMVMYPYHNISSANPCVSSSTGLVLLSKFPFTVEKIDKSALRSGFYADVQCYKIDVEGRSLYLFNSHLQSIGLEDSDKALYHDLTDAEVSSQKIKDARRHIIRKLGHAFRERAIQAEMIKSLVDSVGGNVIVCGDFNDVPGSFATRTVKSAGLTDAFAHRGFGPAITYRANRFFFRIDHIFYRGNLKALDVERPRICTSDHYPLLATFEWIDTPK